VPRGEGDGGDMVLQTGGKRQGGGTARTPRTAERAAWSRTRAPRC